MFRTTKRWWWWQNDQMIMTKMMIFDSFNFTIKRCCNLQTFILLTQYKNFFLAWNARFSNKSDFETIYFVFRLRILKQNENFEKVFKSIVWLSYSLSYKLNNWIENIAQYCVCFLLTIATISCSDMNSCQNMKLLQTHHSFLLLMSLLNNCENTLQYKLIWKVTWKLSKINANRKNSCEFNALMY